MITSRTVLPVAVTTGCLLLGALAPAHAADGDVRVRGTCTEGSTWKLKVSSDDGRLEWEAEVDSDVAGQRWRVAVRQDGARIFAGRARTVGPSGSFSVEGRTADRPGEDRFVLRARHLASGETCRGALTF